MTQHRFTIIRAEDVCTCTILMIERDREYLHVIENSLRESTADILILSYEGFFKLTENALKKMKCFLGYYCDKFELVFYIRSPLSYAASSMSQRVKMCQRAFVDDNCIPFIDYQEILAKLCRVFDKDQINIRLFSKESLPNGNVILDFLSLLHLPKETAVNIAAKSHSKNTSLSNEALLIGDRMAEILDGYLSSSEFQHERRIGERFLPAIVGRKLQLTDLQQERILNEAAPHFEYLYKEFGIALDKEPRTVYKPIKISEDTIDYTAREILRVLVPDFKQPVINTARNESNLNKIFILRVMLTIKTVVFVRAAHRLLRSISSSLR